MHLFHEIHVHQDSDSYAILFKVHFMVLHLFTQTQPTKNFNSLYYHKSA